MNEYSRKITQFLPNNEGSSHKMYFGTQISGILMPYGYSSHHLPIMPLLRN